MRQTTPKNFDELRQRLVGATDASAGRAATVTAPDGDEFWRLGQESPEPRPAPAPVKPPNEHTQRGADVERGVKAMSQQEPSHVAAAVAKVFEPTRAFEDRFARLASAFEQTDRLGKEAVSAFETVKGLLNHLENLAHAFEPMKAFQEQIEVLAREFVPMKGVQDQIAEVSVVFRAHLRQLTGSLDRVKKFQQRLGELGAAFDYASDLQERFERLANAFEVAQKSPPTAAATSSGAAVGASSQPQGSS
jgi:hypothetical protein